MFPLWPVELAPSCRERSVLSLSSAMAFDDERESFISTCSKEPDKVGVANRKALRMFVHWWVSYRSGNGLKESIQSWLPLFTHVIVGGMAWAMSSASLSGIGITIVVCSIMLITPPTVTLGCDVGQQTRLCGF